MSVFDITNACNLQCVYCCRGEYDRSKIVEPSIDDVVEVVRQLISNRGTFVVLQGGEPLLRKDIAEILNRMGQLKTKRSTSFLCDLRELVSNKYKNEVFMQRYKRLLISQQLPMFYLTTNGMIFSEQIEAALFENGFSIDVSLDSVDEATNKLTRKGIDFNLVEKNLSRFSERLAVNISCTVTEYNVDLLGNMLQFTREHGCISLKLSPVIMVGKRNTNDDVFRAKYIEQLNKILDDFGEYQGDIFLNVKLYPHYLQTEEGRQIYNRLLDTSNVVLELHECAAFKMIKEIYVDTNLDVYGCASMKGYKSAVLGNLNSEKLNKLWSGEKRLALLEQLEQHKKYLKDFSGCTGTAFKHRAACPSQDEE